MPGSCRIATPSRASSAVSPRAPASACCGITRALLKRNAAQHLLCCYRAGSRVAKVGAKKRRLNAAPHRLPSRGAGSSVIMSLIPLLLSAPLLPALPAMRLPAEILSACYHRLRASALCRLDISLTDGRKMDVADAAAPAPRLMALLLQWLSPAPHYSLCACRLSASLRACLPPAALPLWHSYHYLFHEEGRGLKDEGRGSLYCCCIP